VWSESLDRRGSDFTGVTESCTVGCDGISEALLEGVGCDWAIVGGLEASCVMCGFVGRVRGGGGNCASFEASSGPMVLKGSKPGMKSRYSVAVAWSLMLSR